MDDDIESPVSKMIRLVQEYKIESAFFATGFLLLVAAAVLFFRMQKAQGTSQVVIASSSSAPKPTQKPKANLLIHIDGAVEKPDVYEIIEGARLKDLLNLANGLSKKADREFFARNFNLAQVLVDQQKIYIPSAGEVVEGIVAGASIPAGSQESRSESVSVNNSSGEELETLPGIGPVTAQKIIAGRPYASLDELVSRKVVGTATFEKIKDLIAL